MAHSQEEILRGSLLRTDGRQASEYEHSEEGRPIAPQLLFQFGIVEEVPAEFARFRGMYMESVDWAEHPDCDGPAGALRRARELYGKDHHSVWRISSAKATEVLTYADEENVGLELRHWPERSHEMHAHLIMAIGFTGVSIREAKRRRGFVRLYLSRHCKLQAS